MNALGLDEQHALLKIVIERLERCNIPYMEAIINDIRGRHTA
jgi:hypothetical protein